MRCQDQAIGFYPAHPATLPAPNQELILGFVFNTFHGLLLTSFVCMLDGRANYLTNFLEQLGCLVRRLLALFSVSPPDFR